jgi:integrase
MRGILTNNPVLQVPSMELPEEVPVFITDEEIPTLMAIAIQEDMFCEVTLALNTGLRLEEMRRLEWQDIDLKHKQLIVTKSKSKRPRTVPLNRAVREALVTQKERYGHLVYVFPGGIGGVKGKGQWTLPKIRSENWWQKLSIRRMQEELPSLKKLPPGRTGRGWHALRHTFATRAVRADIDMFKLKDWMGHKQIDTTMRYVHVARNYDEDIELL